MNKLLMMLRYQWDRVIAVVAMIVGALALLIGWIGVSATPFLAEQLPYVVSGGIGGVLLFGLGAVLYLSADLRDEWRKLDAIERGLAGQQQSLAGDGAVRMGQAGHEPATAEAEAAVGASDAGAR